jgi:hypothetical protein
VHPEQALHDAGELGELIDGHGRSGGRMGAVAPPGRRMRAARAM